MAVIHRFPGVVSPAHTHRATAPSHRVIPITPPARLRCAARTPLGRRRPGFTHTTHTTQTHTHSHPYTPYTPHLTARRQVGAVFAGHDHDGGYNVDAMDVHHIIPPAPLECALGQVRLGRT